MYVDSADKIERLMRASTFVYGWNTYIYIYLLNRERLSMDKEVPFCMYVSIPSLGAAGATTGRRGSHRLAIASVELGHFDANGL